MRTAAGHGAFFAISHAPNIGRDTGWSWRTLERYWELTGDKRAEELLKRVIAGNAALIGKAPLWCGNNPLGHASDWFTQIWSRAAAMTALHTGDPQALEICKTLAEGKDKPMPGSITYGKQTPIDPSYFSSLFAVLYHLTGEEKYKKPVVGGNQGWRHALRRRLLPGLRPWLLNQPPKVKK